MAVCSHPKCRMTQTTLYIYATGSKVEKPWWKNTITSTSLVVYVFELFLSPGSVTSVRCIGPTAAISSMYVWSKVLFSSENVPDNIWISAKLTFHITGLDWRKMERKRQVQIQTKGGHFGLPSRFDLMCLRKEIKDYVTLVFFFLVKALNVWL